MQLHAYLLHAAHYLYLLHCYVTDAYCDMPQDLASLGSRLFGLQACLSVHQLGRGQS